MTTEPTTGPSDGVGRHRQGAVLQTWARSHRFGIAVATVVAVAAGAAGLIVAAFPVVGEGNGLLPPAGVTVSDAAAPWLTSPTDAFGASPTPSVSTRASPTASALPSAAATAAPSATRSTAPPVTAAPAPSRTGPRATPTPGPPAASLPVSYEAEGPGVVRSSGTRLRSVRGASGGYVVAYVGRGETVRFTVTVPAGGRYLLTICYISGDPRAMSLSVDGRTMWGTLPTTRDWYTVGSVTIPVDLSAGGNTIELGNRRDYAPDVDRIVVR